MDVFVNAASSLESGAHEAHYALAKVIPAVSRVPLPFWIWGTFKRQGHLTSYTAFISSLLLDTTKIPPVAAC